MATLFGKHPSEQDATVQNKHNVTAGTKRPFAEGQWGNPLNDDTTKSQSFHARSRQSKSDNTLLLDNGCVHSRESLQH